MDAVIWVEASFSIRFDESTEAGKDILSLANTPGLEQDSFQNQLVWERIKVELPKFLNQCIVTKHYDDGDIPF
jgi:hypothetical protein